PGGKRVEGRVDPGRLLQPRLRRGERRGGPAALLLGAGQAGMGAGRRLAQPLRVAEAVALGAEAGVLAGVGAELLDLRELIAEQIEVPLTRPVPLPQRLELRAEAKALPVGLAVGVTEAQVLLAGEPVEDVHLGGCDRQPSVLVLAVEGEQ